MRIKPMKICPGMVVFGIGDQGIMDEIYLRFWVKWGDCCEEEETVVPFWLYYWLVRRSVILVLDKVWNDNRMKGVGVVLPIFRLTRLGSSSDSLSQTHSSTPTLLSNPSSKPVK